MQNYLIIIFMNINENIRKLEKIIKEMGVYLQNYSYLSCRYLQASKLGTLLKPRQFCFILLFGKQII